MKKVIVTGGTGFIGSNLVKYLLKKKYFVINIDKLSYSSNAYNVKNLNKNKNYIFFKTDLSNRKKIAKILNKYKPVGIFNLAAETHVDRSIDDPSTFINSNILGTYNLLETLKKYSKSKKNFKMVHVSTDEVYGDLLNPNKKSNENDRYNPSSPYSASKASADHLVFAYVRTYKLPVVISNCCNNYGPNQHPEKLIPKIIYNLQKNLNIPIYAKGLNSREWIFVEDHCEALLKIFKTGSVGESYNVGSGHSLRNIDLARRLLKLFKSRLKKNSSSKVVFVKDRPGHDFRYALNSNKIKKKLKWKSKTGIDIGLHKTINWYINNQSYYKSKNSSNFTKRFGILR